MIPGGGQPNMQQLLQQAQKMQQDLAAAQEALALAEVEGQSGGGLVKATVTGSGELRALVIDPKAVDPTDTETLADLVVAAVQAANENARALQQEKLGPPWPPGWAAAAAFPAFRSRPSPPGRPLRTVRPGPSGRGHRARPFPTHPIAKEAVRCTKAWSRT
ncbi:hypothetical protein GCM10020254_41210 [Streptomyces goshikiensis]